jgi:hypothetical protein
LFSAGLNCKSTQTNQSYLYSGPDLSKCHISICQPNNYVLQERQTGQGLKDENLVQGCQIFLETMYQKGGKYAYPNTTKIPNGNTIL